MSNKNTTTTTISSQDKPVLSQQNIVPSNTTDTTTTTLDVEMTSAQDEQVLNSVITTTMELVPEEAQQEDDEQQEEEEEEEELKTPVTKTESKSPQRAIKKQTTKRPIPTKSPRNHIANMKHKENNNDSDNDNDNDNESENESGDDNEDKMDYSDNDNDNETDQDDNRHAIVRRNNNTNSKLDAVIDIMKQIGQYQLSHQRTVEVMSSDIFQLKERMDTIERGGLDVKNAITEGSHIVNALTNLIVKLIARGILGPFFNPAAGEVYMASYELVDSRSKTKSPGVIFNLAGCMGCLYHHFTSLFPAGSTFSLDKMKNAFTSLFGDGEVVVLPRKSYEECKMSVLPHIPKKESKSTKSKDQIQEGYPKGHYIFVREKKFIETVKILITRCAIIISEVDFESGRCTIEYEDGNEIEKSYKPYSEHGPMKGGFVYKTPEAVERTIRQLKEKIYNKDLKPEQIKKLEDEIFSLNQQIEDEEDKNKKDKLKQKRKIAHEKLVDTTNNTKEFIGLVGTRITHINNSPTLGVPCTDEQIDKKLCRIIINALGINKLTDYIETKVEVPDRKVYPFGCVYIKERMINKKKLESLNEEDAGEYITQSMNYLGSVDTLKLMANAIKFDLLRKDEKQTIAEHILLSTSLRSSSSSNRRRVTTKNSNLSSRSERSKGNDKNKKEVLSESEEEEMEEDDDNHNEDDFVNLKNVKSNNKHVVTKKSSTPNSNISSSSSSNSKVSSKNPSSSSNTTTTTKTVSLPKDTVTKKSSSSSSKNDKRNRPANNTISAVKKKQRT